MEYCATFHQFEGSKANLPEYQTMGSSGVDLEAWWPVSVAWEHYEILPGQFRVIPTGLWVNIEPGFEGQIRSRSGLAAKNGVFVLNSPGTIDASYKGELKIILANMGPLTFEVRPGDRIAQMVFTSVSMANCNIKEVERKDGGFGSTGVRGN